MSAADSGLEANAVIGAGYVVIHRLGKRPDRYTLSNQVRSVAQRVVAADRDQTVQL